MPARKKVMIIESEVECVSIGIVSPLKDYRLCWFLNRILNIELFKIDDLTGMTGKQRGAFSRFKFEEPLTQSEFYIISNKDHADYLLPELKQADFILLIKGSYYESRTAEIIKKIKSIEGVQTTLTFNIGELKSKNNILYYDDEKRR